VPLHSAIITQCSGGERGPKGYFQLTKLANSAKCFTFSNIYLTANGFRMIENGKRKYFGHLKRFKSVRSGGNQL